MRLRQTRAVAWVGPAVVALACVVPVALWAQATAATPRFEDTQTTLRSVAVICGLVGITAFASNLILGGRIAVIEPFFGGLDRMYRIHHRIGLVAYNFLLAHGALMVASVATVSWDAVVQLISPSSGWTVTLGVIALAGLLVVMLLTLYARINHEVFLWVHRFFGLVFLIGAVHAFRTPGVKALSPALTVYLGAFALAGLLAYAYRSVFGGQFVFLTFESRSMSQWFRPFSRRPSGPSEIVSLRTGAVRKQFHPFSITSAADSRELQVAIKASGDYTAALEHLEVGDRARIEGPYGSFSYRNASSRRQLWIAGGIGVTPFLSMARSLPEDYAVDFYYAVKSRPQGYFIDAFEELARTHPGLKVIPFPEDESGFLTAEEIERRSGLEDAAILMCGPAPMTSALERHLRQRGVRRSRIHYEEFGFGR